jgi:hypothetical protein
MDGKNSAGHVRWFRESLLPTRRRSIHLSRSVCSVNCIFRNREVLQRSRAELKLLNLGDYPKTVWIIHCANYEMRALIGRKMITVNRNPVSHSRRRFAEDVLSFFEDLNKNRELL